LGHSSAALSEPFHRQTNMSQRRSRFAPFLALVLCLAAGWLYASPYVAFARLGTAAKNGDEQALQGLVDFPSFRESLKGEVSGAVDRGLSIHGHRNPLGALGGVLAGAASNYVVSSLVTPHGIAALVRGAHSAKDAARGDETDASGEKRKDSPVVLRKGYEGLNTFVVHVSEKDSGKERVALVMTRDGLSTWKLSGVRLGSHDD
jgi:hypothetical protein